MTMRQGRALLQTPYSLPELDGPATAGRSLQTQGCLLYPLGLMNSWNGG